MKIPQDINTLFDQIKQFLRTETVMGEPLRVGEIVLIPVIDITFGAGGSFKENNVNNKVGEGAGVGVKISAAAILVIKDNDITAVPLKEKSSFEKIMGLVPDLVVKYSQEENIGQK